MAPPSDHSLDLEEEAIIEADMGGPFPPRAALETVAPKSNVLVLDAGALIAHKAASALQVLILARFALSVFCKMLRQAARLVTIEDVMAEVKDPVARERLALLQQEACPPS